MEGSGSPPSHRRLLDLEEFKDETSRSFRGRGYRIKDRGESVNAVFAGAIGEDLNSQIARVQKLEGGAS
jgi:hypothetical protein